MLTVFYCVITLTYAVTLELRDWITNEKLSKRDVMNFNFYMYSIAFAFFAWWYGLFLWRTKLHFLARPVKRLFGKLLKKNVSNDEHDNVKKISTMDNPMPNIGSLYLRFGAVGE